MPINASPASESKHFHVILMALIFFGEFFAIRKQGARSGSSYSEVEVKVLIHYLEPDIAKCIVACDMQIPAASHGKGKNCAPFITWAVPV